MFLGVILLLKSRRGRLRVIASTRYPTLNRVVSKMADLKSLDLKHLLHFLTENKSRVPDVRRRLDELTEELMERNEKLSLAFGHLNTRHQQDEYRIDDLIELRDKINDGFSVLEENQEYEVEDKVQEAVIIGQLLLALERAQEFAQDIIDHFSEKNEDEIQIEGEDIRNLIRSVDHKLGEAHVQQLAAYLGVNP